MTDHIDPVDYVLGELDADRAAQAERLLTEDPAFRAEVDRLAGMVDALESLPEEAWDPPTPPPLRHPDAAPSRSLAQRISEALRRSITIPVPALGAIAAIAVLVGVALGAGILLSGGSDDDGRVLPLAAVGSGTASGEARVEGDGERLSVSVTGLPVNPTDEVYEVWLLSAPSTVVALGTFRVGESGAGQVEVALPVDPTTYEAIDISREPLDGDPTHSSDSVLRGATA